MLINRDLLKELLEMANFYPVVTVLGPRQSGKTTLVKTAFPDKPYVSLENLDERNFAESDPRSFLESYPEGVILDEIQRLPILLSYIQGNVDQRNKKGLYILTGSHQLALHQSISQSLAGRTAILKLLPFSLSELPTSYDAWSLDDYLLHGLYPRIYHDNLNPTKFYRDYTQTYLERDVRQMINLKDLNQFQRFLKLCASRIGQIFNVTNVGNELGVSNHTIYHWLSILEASFVVFRLQPYYENFGKRIIKTAKFYFYDVGLATYLLDIHHQRQISRDPLRGALVENLLITEFIKAELNRGNEPNCYFYRDSNAREIDLLIKVGNELIPIEIKAATTFHSAFLKDLRYLQQIASERVKKGMLIYSGTHEQSIDGFQIVNYKNATKTFLSWEDNDSHLLE